jgi:hypothetical protein
MDKTHEDEPVRGIVVKWRVEIRQKAWNLIRGDDARKYRMIREWAMRNKLHCRKPDPDQPWLVETHSRDEAEEIYSTWSRPYDFRAREPFQHVVNMAEQEAIKVEKWKEDSLYGDDNTK